MLVKDFNPPFTLLLILYEYDDSIMHLNLTYFQLFCGLPWQSLVLLA